MRPVDRRETTFDCIAHPFLQHISDILRCSKETSLRSVLHQRIVSY